MTKPATPSAEPDLVVARLREIASRLDSATAEVDCFNVYESLALVRESLALAERQQARIREQDEELAGWHKAMAQMIVGPLWPTDCPQAPAMVLFTIHQTRQRAEAAERALAEAKKDAERYRWLREHFDFAAPERVDASINSAAVRALPLEAPK